MIRFPVTRLFLSLTLLLAACGAVGKATVPLDAYTLSPLPVVKGTASAQHLVVELPTASGALTTDRILIKPNALQAEYLPKGRWVDPAPELIQTLLVASLQNSGGYRLVGRDGAGLTPDYVLLVEVNAFQAEASALGTPDTLVRVGLTLSLVREEDQSLIATRRFDQTASAATADTLALVGAFDQATRQVLAAAVAWVTKTAR